MRRLLSGLLLLLSTYLPAQNVINWDGIYKLQLSDFQSAATEIGDVTVYSLASMSAIDFAFHMTSGEFMFTKNFNSKVNCIFRRDASALVAPDTVTALQLLNFARYDFDLAELYARKFRKKLYEEKGAFSDASFFRPAFDQIQKEFVERHSQAAKDTDIGRNAEKLSALHYIVLMEIAEYPDYCKTCKPAKKKK
jgi:hypothetical protein